MSTMPATTELLPGARAPLTSTSPPPPLRRRRALHDDQAPVDDAAAGGDAGSTQAPDTPTREAVAGGLEGGATTGADGAAAVASADTSPEASPLAEHPHDDRYAALLAAGIGLLGIGGASGLVGKSSSGNPPPAAVVVDPKNPDHPKPDLSVPDQKPDPDASKPTGPSPSTPDHPTPEQPKPDPLTPDPPTPDQPTPDQPKPDQPTPDQPKPDQPGPDQPKPDQPQPPDPGKPDPGKPDPTPPADPDPTPSVRVPAAPLLSLAKDTGSSDRDLITSSGSVNVAGLDPGATLAVSLDGGKTWIPRSGDAQLPESMFGADGDKHLQVKQIDAAGHEGAVADLSFTLDRQAPDALHWAMSGEKPALGLTDTIVPLGVEPGARVDYRLDATAPWQTALDGKIPTSIFHHDGPAHLDVRQTDVAGNVGAVSTLTVDIDISAPAAPTVVLLNDTGVSSTDRITSSGGFRVDGIEGGAHLFVSLDGGSSWNEIPADAASLDGLEQAWNYGALSLQFKQTDVAGNASDVTTLSFTLDREARNPNWSSSNPDRTSDATMLNGHDTFKGQASVGTDSLDYRINGGHWETMPADGQLPLTLFGVDGRHQVDLRQTDLAGNVATRSIQVTTDFTPPPPPGLALKHDDGASSTDKITSDPGVAVTGLQSGDSFMYRVNGGEWTSGWDWEGGSGPVIKDVDVVGREGSNTVEVYLIDAAGNVGASSQLTFQYTPHSGGVI
ncbi:Ig-like domain-containing protein [Roseateles sp. L2-2]|uniref:Ig-like domain-containing protein n=1 Tax=Roseateles sp. L2-2 TaxID=3422597 RepID=UPI003D362224